MLSCSRHYFDGSKRKLDVVQQVAIYAPFKNSVLPICLLVSCTYCDYTLVKSTASTNFESFWVQFKSSPIILHVLHLLARLEKITKLFSDNAFHVSDSFPHWQKTGICKHHLEPFYKVLWRRRRRQVLHFFKRSST